MDEDHEEASEDELAACGLMLELTRSSWLITMVGDGLLDGLDESDDPGETGEVVVLRGMIKTAMPYLRDLGAERCWQAAKLIENVRSQIVLDFQLTTQGDDRRN